MLVAGNGVRYEDKTVIAKISPSFSMDRRHLLRFAGIPDVQEGFGALFGKGGGGGGVNMRVISD